MTPITTQRSGCAWETRPAGLFRGQPPQSGGTWAEMRSKGAERIPGEAGWSKGDFARARLPPMLPGLKALCPRLGVAPRVWLRWVRVGMGHRSPTPAFPVTQTEAQRSGFGLERRSSGMSELCPPGRSEGYEACDAADSASGRVSFWTPRKKPKKRRGRLAAFHAAWFARPRTPGERGSAAEGAGLQAVRRWRLSRRALCPAGCRLCFQNRGPNAPNGASRLGSGCVGCGWGWDVTARSQRSP